MRAAARLQIRAFNLRSPAAAPRVPLLSAHPVAPVALASHIAPLLAILENRLVRRSLRSDQLIPRRLDNREDRWCKSLRPGETTLSAIQIAPETLPTADAVPCAAACGQNRRGQLTQPFTSFGVNFAVHNVHDVTFLHRATIQPTASPSNPRSFGCPPRRRIKRSLVPAALPKPGCAPETP